MAWAWHQLGFEGYHFGWLIEIVNLVFFPLLFLTIVYKRRPIGASRWWTLGAYLVCWLPLVTSTIVGHVVYTRVSGYYHAMQISTMAGAMENIAVGQFMVLLQCVWLTMFVLLFMAWKSWMSRTYG